MRCDVVGDLESDLKGDLGEWVGRSLSLRLGDPRRDFFLRSRLGRGGDEGMCRFGATSPSSQVVPGGMSIPASLLFSSSETIAADGWSRTNRSILIKIVSLVLFENLLRQRQNRTFLSRFDRKNQKIPHQERYNYDRTSKAKRDQTLTTFSRSLQQYSREDESI